MAAWIQAACVLEASARKPGNVHPGASFADLTYADFVKSAEVIAPILSHADDAGVGETIFQAVTATREVVGGNSNLGMILLLAPLARVPMGVALDQGITQVLAGLTVEDARWMYRAIRAAQPGGMGDVAEGDVSQEPAGTVLEMMQLAAGRDRIAAEYVSGFQITLNFGAAFLAGVENFGQHWETAIIETHLRLMAEYPDTLIARKCGAAVAEESARRARLVLDAGPLDSPRGQQQLAALDQWLRADGHRRNPGTSADLVAASLFAAFREGFLLPPFEARESGTP
jgi:triphosphoribosyl-dephospho-CoA synthase